MLHVVCRFMQSGSQEALSLVLTAAVLCSNGTYSPFSLSAGRK